MIQMPQIEPISKLVRGHLATLARVEDGPVFLTQHGEAVAVLVSVDQWQGIAAAMQRLEDAEDLVDALTEKLERMRGKRTVLQMSKAEVEEWLAEDAEEEVPVLP